MNTTYSSQELAEHLLTGKYASSNSISLYVLTPTRAFSHEQRATTPQQKTAETNGIFNDPGAQLCQVIDKYKAQLYKKVENFKQHGHTEAANSLGNYLTSIEAHYYDANEHPQQVLANITATLKNAQEDEVLSTHRGCKDIITNFLIALTGVGLIALHCTSDTRGSFWYKTNTDTINQIENFKAEIDKLPKP